MLQNLHWEKLVEAIGFFVRSTRSCGTIKLFKLLYWLDYHHFRETGRSVTGLEYFALPMGPVPTELYDQLKDRKGLLAENFDITSPRRVDTEDRSRTIDDDEPTGENGGAKFIPASIKPKKPYVRRYLTKREQRIAERLAEIFKDANAKDISDISHVRGGPWRKALKSGGPNAKIDFLSAIVPMTDGDYLDEEELRHKVAEFAELNQHLS